MTCDNCGASGAKLRRVTRSFGQGQSAFLIENLPVVHCASCGESYLTAATLAEIERIRLHWRELSVEKQLPVVRFGGAA
jgi:YgiT-type zinc finger domain-containing protein